jgi:hypothetical protein
MSSCRSRPASVSAWVADSEEPVPDQDLFAVRGERLGHLAHASVVLAEATTRGDRPWLALADDLVGDGKSFHVGNGHVSFPFLPAVRSTGGFGNGPVVYASADRFCRQQFAELPRKPSECFKEHWYATDWFDQNRGNLQGLMGSVGEDDILFETDFPHPTCLYPKPLDTIADKMSTLRPETRRKVLGENAAKLYRL